MTWFDQAVRLLRALPFKQQAMLLYGASCWTDSKFESTAGEHGHAAVRLLRSLEPHERVFELYDAAIPETWPKPRPVLKLVE
jgi:hypothetical protein